MALIAVAADKGAPGVTTAAIVLAAVWPRPVLLAECDPAGGDLVYRLPAAGGGRLDPQRGLLSLAVAGRRGIQPQEVWEHTQKLHGGLDVLAGVTTAEQGAGLAPLWDSVGAVLARLPRADVIADCGRIGVDGPRYDLLARASAVVLVTRGTLAEVVRLRERIAVLAAAAGRRDSFGTRISVVVISDYKRFHATLGEVGEALSRSRVRVNVAGGLAYEPRSAEQLRGEWGGKLDKSLLVRTARDVATRLAVVLPAIGEPGTPGHSQPLAGQRARPPALAPRRAAPGPLDDPRGVPGLARPGGPQPPGAGADEDAMGPPGDPSPQPAPPRAGPARAGEG